MSYEGKSATIIHMLDRYITPANPRFCRTICCITTLLAVYGAACVASASAQDQQTNQIREKYFHGEFGQVLTTYSQSSSEQRESPLSCFFVGQSYLRRHDFEHAAEYLRKAEAGQLGAQQRERADASLARIAVLKELCPPFFHDYDLDGFKIRLYAKDSAWSRNLAKQVPSFLARAKEGFGNSNAFVAFYLFEDHSSNDRFFDSWVSEPQGISHRGTGGMQIVMYCRYYPTGKEVGANDISDLYFRVLHEYSHALCHTTYGDNFKMPQWLNEGMADYFGWIYKPTGDAEAIARLQKFAKQRPARSYVEISTKLHDDNEVGYAVGDVMVTELFKGKPLSIYGEIINAARSNGGNFETAVQQATGRDPRSVYAEILKTYWKVQ